MIKSVLSEIKGVGETTETALLQAFKTVENMKTRSVEELSAVVGRKRAEIVYAYLQSL
ncbi:MAG: hypothetical protein K2M86_02270 [Odoribacter sp.]|nr:hypothetical protein [Odoribacter sp.]